MISLTQLSGNLRGITGKTLEKFRTLRTSDMRLSKEKRNELLGKFHVTLNKTKEGLSKFIMEL
jgi:hypothetical protein